MGDLHPKEALSKFRDESVRRLKESEQAVEHQFQEARLFVSLGIALLLVGFLLVAQWRGNAVVVEKVEGRSDQELALLIQELSTVNQDLRAETYRLESRLARTVEDEAGREELLDQAKEELLGTRVVAGLEPAKGDGVTVEIIDPQHLLLAQDMVALIQELRSAGAEAISVQGVRIGALTGFSDSPEGIRADGSVIGHDITIDVIGPTAELEQALSLPGGVQSRLTAYPSVSMVASVDSGIEVPAAEPRPYDVGNPDLEG